MIEILLISAAAFYIFYAANRANRIRRENKRDRQERRREELIELLRNKKGDADGEPSHQAEELPK